MDEPKSSATTATDSSFGVQTVEAGEAHKWSALSLTVYVIDQFGFTPAFYLAGMLLHWFVKEELPVFNKHRSDGQGPVEDRPKRCEEPLASFSKKYHAGGRESSLEVLFGGKSGES